MMSMVRALQHVEEWWDTENNQETGVCCGKPNIVTEWRLLATHSLLTLVLRTKNASMNLNSDISQRYSCD
jgi:hypothetical protein